MRRFWETCVENAKGLSPIILGIEFPDERGEKISRLMPAWFQAMTWVMHRYLFFSLGLFTAFVVFNPDFPSSATVIQVLLMISALFAVAMVPTLAVIVVVLAVAETFGPKEIRRQVS